MQAPYLMCHSRSRIIQCRYPPSPQRHLLTRVLPSAWRPACATTSGASASLPRSLSLSLSLSPPPLSLSLSPSLFLSLSLSLPLSFSLVHTFLPSVPLHLYRSPYTSPPLSLYLHRAQYHLGRVSFLSQVSFSLRCVRALSLSTSSSRFLSARSQACMLGCPRGFACWCEGLGLEGCVCWWVCRRCVRLCSWVCRRCVLSGAARGEVKRLVRRKGLRGGRRQKRQVRRQKRQVAHGIM